MQVHIEVFTKDMIAPSFILDEGFQRNITIGELKTFVKTEVDIHEQHLVFVLTSWNVWGDGEFESQQVVNDTWHLGDLGPRGKHRLVPYKDAVGVETMTGFFFNVFCVGIQNPEHLSERSRRTEFLCY